MGQQGEKVNYTYQESDVPSDNCIYIFMNINTYMYVCNYLYISIYVYTNLWK
jgi:hypothetical protein